MSSRPNERVPVPTALRRPALALALAFGLAIGLVGAPPVRAQGAGVVRGPYLQRGSHERVTVRWRTDQPTPSRVRFGAEPGSLTDVELDPLLTTEHEVELTGLTANTRYYYAVGTDAADLAGDDPDHFFVTAPPPGETRPTRVWILGDSGTADANAAAVRDAYLAYAGIRHTDLWLMLGDNAYPDGTDAEYQAALFDMYPGMLRRSVLWPTLGNHDYASVDPFGETGGYYDVFTLPTGGEAGGLPTGTESYYAFDFGNIHFVVLDSHGTPRNPGGLMMTWLEQDLAATTADWVIAFWHHPPYSKGSHDSDTESRMVEMREYAVPILDDYGVDLTFSGHSHDYERSYLIEGHYDDSTTFVESMKVDPGDGDPDGDGYYAKAAVGPIPHSGIVHTVAGSAGKATGGSLDHPAMFASWNELGSVVLDIDGNRLDAVFLDDQGQVLDRYTMVKGSLPPPATPDFVSAPLAGPAPLTVHHFDTSGGQPTTWVWDFEDDGQSDSLERNPAMAYDQPGLYSVRHHAANPGGGGEIVRQDWICVTAGVPAPVDGLTIAGDRRTVAWNPAPHASSYDVVRGSLNALRAANGDFQAAASPCLAEQTVQPSIDDTAAPPASGGLFYLIRALNCAGQFGTYDSGVPSQSGPRDAGLAAAAGACTCDATGDADGDSICTADDPCPADPWNDQDGDLVCGDVDLCPTVHDPTQADQDADGAGDACDPCPADPLDDADADGLCADADNCPGANNPDQGDLDGDGTGDPCDLCPAVPDPGQADDDMDGLGDACDPCPGDAVNDGDADGLCATEDNCPTVANPLQEDDDLDGVGDACDPCPYDALNDADLDGLCESVDNCDLVFNPSQADQDWDGLGDACDPCPGDPGNDADLDGVCGDVDNCPFDSNPAQTDSDTDGTGDVCDPCPMDRYDDADGDGLCADMDNCPFDFNPGQADSDGDGIGNVCDPRP